MGHPNADVLKVIIEALAMLLKAHPKQALWHLSSLCLSISNTRRQVLLWRDFFKVFALRRFVLRFFSTNNWPLTAGTTRIIAYTDSNHLLRRDLAQLDSVRAMAGIKVGEESVASVRTFPTEIP